MKSLRDQIAERATDWALMYPLANWPGMGVAAADRGQLDGIARRLAERYGADIADAVMAVVQPELDKLNGDLGRYRDALGLAKANPAPGSSHRLRDKLRQAEAERARLYTTVERARYIATEAAASHSTERAQTGRELLANLDQPETADE